MAGKDKSSEKSNKGKRRRGNSNSYRKENKVSEEPKIPSKKSENKKENEYIIKKIITIDATNNKLFPKNSTLESSKTPIEKKSKLFEVDYTQPIDVINLKIETIQDLIEVGKLYLEPDFSQKNYSINVSGIYEMIPVLQELDSMVGISDIKKDILEFIIYFSQNLHKEFQFKEEKNGNNEMFTSPLLQILNIPLSQNTQNDNYNQGSKKDNYLEDDSLYDMKHIVIYGPPGSGKTLLGRILAKISLFLGISKNDKFIIAKRSDLIGEFLGMTAIKTQKMIDKAVGGTIFIDEAYSLGSSEKDKDIYAKECIDTLNQNLTEKKGQFQCIIAGYEEELEKNFFSLNPGLKRRFPFKYRISSYNSKELLDILVLKINKMGWKLKPDVKKWLYDTDYLKDKMDNFQYFGGDIETWLFNIKIQHGKRVFGQHPSIHKTISKEDIESGYSRYVKHKQVANGKKELYSHIYI